MSWLFNDPIDSGLAQFDHAHSQTVKNNLKAKKIKLPQLIFFPRKTTNKIFMYLLAPFILQGFKRFLELIQSYEDVPFPDPKWPIWPEQNIFGTDHYSHL